MDNTNGANNKQTLTQAQASSSSTTDSHPDQSQQRLQLLLNAPTHLQFEFPLSLIQSLGNPGSPPGIPMSQKGSCSSPQQRQGLKLPHDGTSSRSTLPERRTTSSSSTSTSAESSSPGSKSGTQNGRRLARSPSIDLQYSPTSSSSSILDQAAAMLEEKRKRNTEASARFRQKRKERNHTLEQQITELTGRAEHLEKEAEQLRMENNWLKEIVIMKSRVQTERVGDQSRIQIDANEGEAKSKK